MLGGTSHVGVGRPSTYMNSSRLSTAVTMTGHIGNNSVVRVTPPVNTTVQYQQATVTPAFVLPGLGRGAASAKPPSM